MTTFDRDPDKWQCIHAPGSDNDGICGLVEDVRDIARLVNKLANTSGATGYLLCVINDVVARVNDTVERWDL